MDQVSDFFNRSEPRSEEIPSEDQRLPEGWTEEDIQLDDVASDKMDAAKKKIAPAAPKSDSSSGTGIFSSLVNALMPAQDGAEKKKDTPKPKPSPKTKPSPKKNSNKKSPSSSSSSSSSDDDEDAADKKTPVTDHPQARLHWRQGFCQKVWISSSTFRELFFPPPPAAAAAAAAAAQMRKLTLILSSANHLLLS